MRSFTANRRQSMLTAVASGLVLSGLVLSGCQYVPGLLEGDVAIQTTGLLATHTLTDDDTRAKALGLQLERIAPVGEVRAQPSADSLRRAAAQIDRMLADYHKTQQVSVQPAADEEQLLRRLYLDIAGRIPTVEEVQRYKDDNSKDRFTKLIGALLRSDAWASHNFNYWADALRLKSRLRGRGDGGPYISYVKDSLKANKPYDVFVREMLTADGSLWDEGNGATGYYIRDAGMPEDNLANTMQLFLGTSIACAQCHDHPFDKWTRHDFMALSAFTHSTRAGRANRKKMRGFAKEVRQMDLDQQTRTRLRRLVQAVHTGVQGGTKGERRLPKDYQYKDGKPGQVIQAAVPFGEKVSVDAGQDPRAVFAGWLASADNPRFAKVIANRMWKKVMGVGLFEPVDDLRDDTVITAPALLDNLAALMVELDFDLQAFESVLYQTKLYQRHVAPEEPVAGKTWHFTGPTLRRLSAEQLWDSVMTLIVPALDERVVPIGNMQQKRYQELADASPKELVEHIQNYQKFDKVRKQYQGDLRKLRTKMKNTENRQERRKIGMQMREMRNEMQEQMGMNGEMAGRYRDAWRARQGKDGRWAGLSADLVRASELQAPAPEGHFLRRFGQSDRDLIDNSNDQPTVPQALTLLNGYVDTQLLNSRSRLVKDLQALRGSGSDAVVDYIFTAVLTRSATSSERRMAKQVIAADAQQGIADLVWVLLNGPEFLFIQ